MPGFLHAFPLTSSKPSYSYRTNVEDNVSRSTYTFTATDIGTASGNRYVVVGVFIRSTGTAGITSVTVGGVSATLLKAQTIAATGTVALYSALVTTGSTGDIVVTLPAAAIRAKVATWAVYGLSQNSAANITSSSTAGPLSLTLTPYIGSIVIGLAFDAAGGSACAWTGLTEDWDAPISGGPNEASGASIQATSNSSITISAAITGSTTPLGVAVALR